MEVRGDKPVPGLDRKGVAALPAAGASQPMFTLVFAVVFHRLTQASCRRHVDLKERLAVSELLDTKNVAFIVNLCIDTAGVGVMR